MKRSFAILAAAVITIGLVAAAFAGGKATMSLKAGDEVYACNCGEACPCHTLSKNPGNCTCGKEMVKATVVKAEADSASLKAAGWAKERSFKTTGKYVCACGEACKCDTISQNPGKCSCGKEMKKAI